MPRTRTTLRALSAVLAASALSACSLVGTGDDSASPGEDPDSAGSNGESAGGAVVLVTHDSGAVEALDPDKVIVLPEGTEDLWSTEYLELVQLA